MIQDFEVDLTSDTTPDAQLAAMSDAQLAAMLDDQLEETLWNDKQWHVPDDLPSTRGRLTHLVTPAFDLPAMNITAQEIVSQQEADEKAKRVREMVEFHLFFDSLISSARITSTTFEGGELVDGEFFPSSKVYFLGDYPELSDGRLMMTSLTVSPCFFLV